MIVWTKEMEEELLETKNCTQFSKKYNIGYNTSRRKLMTLLGVNSLKSLYPKAEENSVEDLVKAEEPLIQECKMFENIKRIIVDIDALKKKGINFYIADSRKQISNYDKQFSDYRHALETSLETLTDKELIQISKNIGIIGRKRRVYKTEMEFLDNNRVETQGFLDFLRKIDEETRKLDNKIYSTKVLKEEMESVVIVSKNNDLLKDLEDENKKLQTKILEFQNGYSQAIPEEVRTRLYNLEKFNLKEKRKKQREKGQLVAIDKLKSNWKELFFSELDVLTRNGIMEDCYAKYTGVNMDEIKELEMWGTIIPEYLYEKKYFLK